MDKAKLLEYLKEELEISKEKLLNVTGIQSVAYYGSQFNCIKIYIEQIENGKFDKQPCEACKDWAMTTATFCPFCGRELSK